MSSSPPSSSPFRRPTIKRTYGRSSNFRPLSSIPIFPSSPRSSDPPEPVEEQQHVKVASSTTTKRKRDKEGNDLFSFFSVESKEGRVATKKRRVVKGDDDYPPKPKPKAKSNASILTQLHLASETALRTCPTCQLSYTIGAPEDENLHKAHCARVTKGMEWNRDEVKLEGKDVTVVSEGVKLKGKGRQERCRIVKFPADIGGKLGTKLATLLQTINTILSSPDLPPSVLSSSQAYLFLLPTSSTQSQPREKIVGCVIAQRIKSAMQVAPPSATTTTSSSTPTTTKPNSLICVDVDSGLFCLPKPLPTPLGVPRLFVSSSHRSLGIATLLLDAAAKTFIHGCELDPKKGEVAFSQPTSAGRGVMEKWGAGGVRIFEE